MSEQLGPDRDCTSCESCILRDLVTSGQAMSRIDSVIEAYRAPVSIPSSRGGSNLLGVRMYYRNQMLWRSACGELINEFTDAIPNCVGVSTKSAIEVPNPEYERYTSHIGIVDWILRRLVEHRGVPKNITEPSELEHCQNDHGADLIRTVIV